MPYSDCTGALTACRGPSITMLVQHHRGGQARALTVSGRPVVGPGPLDSVADPRPPHARGGVLVDDAVVLAVPAGARVRGKKKGKGEIVLTILRAGT